MSAKTQYDRDRILGLTVAEIAVNSMIEALDSFSENEYIDLAEPYEALPPKTWPSTISYIETHCHGFYGTTAFAAEKGTGKTMLATASAMEAAATGEWQVCFFLAEDDYDGFRERFNLNVEAFPHLEDCIPNFHLFSVGRGQTPTTICKEIALAVDTTIETPILTVMDSINSIVNLGQGRYLDMLKDFGLWAMYSRRISRGDASFMLTTESNKRGESKGEGIPFWADCYVKMKKKTDNIVELHLEKTRRTGGEGPMGKHFRTWMKQRFISQADAAPLHVVARSGSGREDLEF